MTNLRLHFSADRTFEVMPISSQEVLGHVTYVFDAAEQPIGYCFKASNGKSSKVASSIADALREYFGGEVHFNIDPII